MRGHAIPNVRNFNQDLITLPCGANDLNCQRISSQIAGEITDIALSLKSDKN